MLRSRAPLALAVLAGTVVLASVVQALLPPRFTATVPVLIEIATLPGESADSRAARAALLAAQAGIVGSGRVALKVVDSLRSSADPLAAARRDAPSGAAGADPMPRHVMADRLIERLVVVPAPASGVLEIGFRGDDPRSAARLADAFARAYVDTLAEIRADIGRQGAAFEPDPPGRGLSRIGAVALDVARPPSTPDGPGLLAVIGMALPVGGLLALLIVALAESRRPRLHSVDDLCRVLPDIGVDTLHEAFGRHGRAAAGSASRSPAPTGVETGVFAPVAGARVGQPERGGAAGRVRPEAGSPGRASGAAPDAGSPWPDTRPWPAGEVVTGSSRDRADRPTPERLAGGGNAGLSHAGWRFEPTLAEATESAPAARGGSPVEPSRGAAAGTSPERPPIGLLLVQAGLIHAPEVERTLAWARQEGLRFGEAAVARRLVTAEQLDRVLASQFEFPLLQPGRSTVSDEVVAAFGARSAFVTDLRRLRAALDGGVLAPSARRSVAVLGLGQRPGRTFLAANLAVSLAQAGRRTLLIDADLRGGRIHAMFGLHNRSGLASMLNRRIDPGALQPVAGLGSLTVIACGPRPPNPTELLSRESFGQLLASFRRAFDAVVLDTCGTEGEPDARLVARMAGAALLVTRRGIGERAEADALALQLRHDRVVLAAALLNRR